jgi:general stress protein 13
MELKHIIRCQVTGIQPYGVFVSCDQQKGLIHISELSDFFVSSIEDIIKVNDFVDCFVIENDGHHLKLSLKKAYVIPPKIQHQVKIITGFLSLERALPHFIEKAKKLKETRHDSIK